jgi:hypothetical protein
MVKLNGACFIWNSYLWYIVCKPKNPNLGKSCSERCWYILWPFGLFYGRLVYFVAIWYVIFGMVIWYIFPAFVCCTKGISGNPGPYNSFVRIYMYMLLPKYGYIHKCGLVVSMYMTDLTWGTGTLSCFYTAMPFLLKASTHSRVPSFLSGFFMFPCDSTFYLFFCIFPLF